MKPKTPHPPAPVQGPPRILRWLLLVLLLAGIGLTFVYRERLDAQALQQWVQGAGAAAPLVFMAVYALGTVLFLPGSLLTLAGGALFGPVLGTFYNLTGATLGALLAFLIARYLAADWVEQRTGGRLRQLKEGVEKESWRFVAFVRLVPLFPFNLLNYALGLTRIRTVHYLLATYVCMLPGAIAYTYLGYAGREAVAGGEGLIHKALLAIALLALVAFLPRLVARFRQGPTQGTSEQVVGRDLAAGIRHFRVAHLRNSGLLRAMGALNWRIPIGDLIAPDLSRGSLSIEALCTRLTQGDDLLLLDVRSTTDYSGEAGHIAGARNIPLEELNERVEELKPYMERPIALICTTDRRSRKAAGILAQRGFADVHVVSGGMTEWNRTGLPTHTHTGKTAAEKGNDHPK
jgi:uncharacterized membrane protein YdjX (TVP38/TMEM64 family)/rhodanese-related sulfurtransferase